MVEICLIIAKAPTEGPSAKTDSSLLRGGSYADPVL